MKLLLMSDTHRMHYDLPIPEEHYDVAIHCGDGIDCGKMQGSSLSDIEMWSKDFFTWFEGIDASHRIFVPGNHDGCFEENDMTSIMSEFDVKVLINSGIEIGGKLFWGFPYTPEFCGWAFMKPKESDDMREAVSKIDNNTNILISHGPAFGILDNQRGKQDSLGCRTLLEKVSSLDNLNVHCFGHIHHPRSTMLKDGRLFVNCSSMDDMYFIRDQGSFTEIEVI